MRAVAAALLCAMCTPPAGGLKPDIPSRDALEGWNSRRLRRLAESMGMTEEEDDAMRGRRDLRRWIDDRRPTPAPPPPRVKVPPKSTLLGWRTRELRELAERMGLTETDEERMTSRRHYRAWIEARRPQQVPSDEKLERMSKRRLAALASELGMTDDEEEGLSHRRDYVRWIKAARSGPMAPLVTKGDEFWDTDCQGEDLYIGGLYQKQCGMTLRECTSLCIDAADSGCNAFVHNYAPGEGPNPQKRKDGCCWLKSGCTERKTHRGKHAVVMKTASAKLELSIWDTDCRGEDLYVDGAYQKFCDASFADCRGKCAALPTCGAVVHNYATGEGGSYSTWQDGCCWLKTGCRDKRVMGGKRSMVIRDLPPVTPQPPAPYNWTDYGQQDPYQQGYAAGRAASGPLGSYEEGFAAGQRAARGGARVDAPPTADGGGASLRGAARGSEPSSSTTARASSRSDSRSTDYIK